MFRYYSLLSPKGTPDPAALAAAIEAPHEWDVSGGPLTLRVLGVQTNSPFFCRTKEALFLHQPRKIFRVSLPPPEKTSSNFVLEAWETDSQMAGAALAAFPRLTTPLAWTTRRGAVVNLVDEDKKAVRRVRDNFFTLPGFNVGSRDDTIQLTLPLGFAALLDEKTPGDVLWEVRKKEENIIALTARTESTIYECSQIVLDLEEMLGGAQKIWLVSDRQVEKKARFFLAD